MYKQGIIVVSHPRSGSTEFIRILAHFVAKQVSPVKPVAILSEFFFWGDASTFGGLPRLVESDLVRFPHQETVLESRFGLPKFKPDEKIVYQNNFCQPAIKIFTSHQHVLDYYIDQVQKRIDYINETISDKHFSIIKSFPGAGWPKQKTRDILHLQQSLILKLKNIEPVFFYRNNLVDAIYSMLIKWYYIDLPAINDEKKLHGSNGHNFFNTMPALQPDLTMIIDKNRLSELVETLCETLRSYQDQRHLYKNIISYDQVFVEKKFNLDWDDQTFEVKGYDNVITLGYDNKVEFPMNYQAAKKDYFKNTDIVVDFINKTITRYGLWEVVNELGIVVE